jgi:16S rRNA processing protein RimM
MSANRRRSRQRNNDAAPPPEGGGQAWIAVGEIVGAFGIRGEVKVVPQTDFPERFAQTPILYLGDARAPHAVQSARQHQRIIILKLEGVDDMTSAARLRGVTLWIPESERMPLPADQFYLSDVVGLPVTHVNGQPLGTVVDYISSGVNDLFVVRTSGGRDVLLPAVNAFIRELDIPARVLRVEPIPGLFDDQAENAGDNANPNALAPAPDEGADKGADKNADKNADEHPPARDQDA